jgi:hypothetical protein
MQKRFLIFGGIIGLIIIAVIFGIIILTQPVKESACNWVFKTDPTNIGHVQGQLNSDGAKIMAYTRTPIPTIALNNGYFTMWYGCNKVFSDNFVFFEATTTNDNTTSAELLNAIKDANPFTEFYFCKACLQKDLFSGECGGNIFANILNKIIDNNELDSRCQKII